jgi:DNA-binding Lrp family transcriptional regulator
LETIVPIPACVAGNTDLAIVNSLRRDPLAPHSLVAKELGISFKTVKRRVAKLTEKGKIYALPIMDLKVLHGIIPVELVVTYASSDAKAPANQQIMSHVKDWLVFVDTSGSDGCFGLALPNVSQVELISRWAKQLDGLSEVHVQVLWDIVMNRRYYEMSGMPASIESARAELLASSALLVEPDSMD